MTITTHRDAPCWQVIDSATGQPPEAESGDGWAHYATREEAVADRDERLAELPAEDYPDGLPEYGVARSFGKPCLGILCDSCGATMDASGEGWTHFDPDEHPPMSVDWADIEWIERGDKHYHEDCAPPWCESCEVEGHDVDDCTQDGAA